MPLAPATVWGPWVEFGQVVQAGRRATFLAVAGTGRVEPQVLARVDVIRLDPEYPNPAEWAVGIAARQDGKLWLVGLSSGELWLASLGGASAGGNFPVRAIIYVPANGWPVPSWTVPGQGELLLEARRCKRCCGKKAEAKVGAVGFWQAFLLGRRGS